MPLAKDFRGQSKRMLILVASVTLFNLTFVALAPSVPAAVRIKRINFDPTGTDSGTNRHLRKEYVLIKNVGTHKKSLRGWKLHDAGRDHVFRFRRLVLEPGDRVRIRTGKGQDSGTTTCATRCTTTHIRYWDLENYVWDNDGDRATLRRRSGQRADRCRYSASDTSPKRC